VALVLQGLSSSEYEGQQFVVTEFDEFTSNLGAEDSSPSTFDIKTLASSCVPDQGEAIVPPDIYQQLVGASIAVEDPDWGRKFTAAEKAQFVKRKQPVVQMTDAERAPAWKLADLPKKTNYTLEMATFNATQQMFVENSAFNASAAFIAALAKDDNALSRKRRRKMLAMEMEMMGHTRSESPSDNQEHGPRGHGLHVEDEHGFTAPASAAEMTAVLYDDILKARKPMGGKLFIDPDTGYINVIDHHEHTPHSILRERHIANSSESHLTERCQLFATVNDKKILINDCEKDTRCCMVKYIYGVEVMNRWCAYGRLSLTSLEKPFFEMVDYDDLDGSSYAFPLPIVMSSYQSPSIYWPSPSNVFEISASAEIFWDPAQNFADTTAPTASGCIQMDLACENFMIKAGLGWAASEICSRFYLGGRRICVSADAMTSGKCKTGTRSVNKLFVERYKCHCNWIGLSCQTCHRHVYRWVSEDTYDHFQMAARIGVFGELYGGLDMWGVAGIDLNAKVSWYHMTENPFNMVGLSCTS
jgi:hypothetical protein